MSKPTSPNSREELEGLHEEGKITDEEYEELLAALTPRVKREPSPGTGRRHKEIIGWIALGLMIIGVVLVAIFYAVVAALHPPKYTIALPLFAFFLLCELPACLLGIIAWRTVQGKIAAIGAPLLMVLMLLALA